MPIDKSLKSFYEENYGDKVKDSDSARNFLTQIFSYINEKNFLKNPNNCIDNFEDALKELETALNNNAPKEDEVLTVLDILIKSSEALRTKIAGISDENLDACAESLDTNAKKFLSEQEGNSNSKKIKYFFEIQPVYFESIKGAILK